MNNVITLGRFVIAGLVIIRPPAVSAHGETSIRIATLSRKISTATTNVAELYLSRGELHREHRDWAAAEADYAQAGKLKPDLLAVVICRANLLADMDRLAEAEAAFTKVLNQRPEEGDAFIGRARVLLKLNRRLEAIADYQRGIANLSVPDVNCYLELAKALVEEHRSPEALLCLDEGVKRLGSVISLHEQALQLELASNDLEASLRRVDEILKVAPRKEAWLARRGDILLLSGRTAEAQLTFKAALRAIDALPPVLQKSPSVLQLVDRIRSSLGQIVPAVAKSED